MSGLLSQVDGVRRHRDRRFAVGRNCFQNVVPEESLNALHAATHIGGVQIDIGGDEPGSVGRPPDIRGLGEEIGVKPSDLSSLPW